MLSNLLAWLGCLMFLGGAVAAPISLAIRLVTWPLATQWIATVCDPAWAMSATIALCRLPHLHPWAGWLFQQAGLSLAIFLVAVPLGLAVLTFAIWLMPYEARRKKLVQVRWKPGGH